ncbi:MAG: hypothetical protein U5M51_16615 [Emticicia sp.]|nr:hypothetical protein [Emticicia sp.]
MVQIQVQKPQWRLSEQPEVILAREKIIEFEGFYHGHGDSFLIAAGSGAFRWGA